MEKKKRRHFPDEFKRQAVERLETSGLPLFEVAAELGVHESQLRRWARQLGQNDALTAGRRQSREVRGPSPADLAAENARLPAWRSEAPKVGHGTPDLRADGPAYRASSVNCSGRRRSETS